MSSHSSLHTADDLKSSVNGTLAQQTLSLPSVRERRTQWDVARTWSAKGAFALLDQGLISGANFVVGILLARGLAPDQYGAYALAFEVFLFLSVAYGALILEPLSVFGSSVYRDSNREYFGALLRIHSVIAVVICLGLGACALVVQWVSPSGNVASALIGVAIASPCLLLFWLARRAFYVKLSPRHAAMGAFVYSGVVLCGLLIAYYRGILSPLVAFLLMAVGALVTAPMMLAWLGFSMRVRSSIARSAEVIRRHWAYGRWALGSAVAIWFSGAIYYPLLGSFHGLADAGSFKALMNFSSPIGQVFAAMSLLSLPYASRVYYGNKSKGSHRMAIRLAVIYAGGTILYWLIVVLLRQPIARLLYAGKYLEITGLIPWLGLGSILRISATSQAVILRAMHSPSLVFVAYVASSLVGVLVGVPCTWAFGIPGAVFTLVLSSAVALGVVSVMVHRSTIHS